MGAQDQAILSAQTDSGENHSGFLLTKVSNGGHRFFATGAYEDVEADKGLIVAVAQTSLFPADARRFESLPKARRIAQKLNDYGIGGACWNVGLAAAFLDPNFLEPREQGR
ncbi:hypothetical protein ABWH98_05655 [Labrenzia sp. ac12]